MMVLLLLVVVVVVVMVVVDEMVVVVAMMMVEVVTMVVNPHEDGVLPVDIPWVEKPRIWAWGTTPANLIFIHW